MTKRYETPVVFWGSEWIVVEDEFEVWIDRQTHEEKKVPKMILVGTENEEFWRYKNER